MMATGLWFGQVTGLGMAELASLVQRLEVAVGPTATYVAAYDDVISGSVAQYMTLSKQIGGDVLKHADMMKQAFSCQRQMLVTASGSQKPNETVLSALLQPVSKVIEQVQTLREQSRTSPHFNHLSAVSESVPALGWVAVAPKPGPFVKEMQDAAMFYTNRVLKDYKEKDKTHVDWVKAYLSIWTEMQNYIKTHHTTGLVWSKTGPVASASAGRPAPAGAAVAAPPPPGPPPPPMPQATQSAAASEGPDTRNALFAAINKGADVTTGLKHVSDKEKTHKNTALRSQAPVRMSAKPFTSPRAAASSSSSSSSSGTKLPPVLELDGKKWKVTELKQVVYAYKCNNSTLQVKGKINSITLDNCKKVGLVFDDVVGIVEVINCRDVKVQFKTVWDGSKLVTTATEIAG
ncbi:hypothetical protein CRUP_019924 [Coryphaenoides rupestris]|nr:hypothetical protein CRUP_019924 [Coryphaenoides rupestris]